MSWLGWGPSTTPQFEELVEKACSPNNLPFPQSEDIATSLEITDLIRSKAVQPKPAMQSLKRRIQGTNQRVQMYTLNLVDTCIKNGGDHFLAEIASKEFVEMMSFMIKATYTNGEVKQLAIKLFQQWAIAFRAKPELAFLVDVYNELRNSGVNFPPEPTQTSSHLLTTTTAPNWVDSDVCMRCRTPFTFTNRKHHCRNCGLVFDQACSSKTMPLPKFGITEEVRVCDTCFAKGGKGVPASGPAPPVPVGRTPRSRRDFDADLQRAIELSLQDSQPSGSNFVGSEPPLVKSGRTAADDDEELRLAIEASLREMEARPSAPQGQDEPEYRPLPTFDLAPRETETILTFSNTLDSMAAYGERDLRRFPQAHMLYEQAYMLGPKLQRNAEEKHTKQQMLQEMQAKLGEVIGLYGHVLDGQQAYATRRYQEEQQRRYQQQMYSYAPQQQPYSAYPGQPQNDYRYASPVPNGHASPYPQQQHQAYGVPPQTAKAGSSLYPSMPSFQYQPAYAQQPYQPAAPPSQPYATQPTHTPQPYAISSSQPQPQLQAPQLASSPPHPGMDRSASLRIPSAGVSNPPQFQRHQSMTYGSVPQVSEPAAQGYNVPDLTGASAPPPVDMASHPASSPTLSVRSALPSVTVGAASAPPQGSYASPAPASVALPASPAPPSQSGIPQQPAYGGQAYNQAPQQQPHSYQAPQAGQQQPHQQQQPYQHPQQQQQQQQQQHVYSVNSFPAAPGAVFPNAPAGVPEQGLEKQEKEEALLIEL